MTGAERQEQRQRLHEEWQQWRAEVEKLKTLGAQWIDVDPSIVALGPARDVDNWDELETLRAVVKAFKEQLLGPHSTATPSRTEAIRQAYEQIVKGDER